MYNRYGQKLVCKEWAGRCGKKDRPITFDRVDQSFQAMSEKDLQMEQLMASMKEAGGHNALVKLSWCLTVVLWYGCQGWVA